MTAKLTEQLKLTTGKQEAACPTCDHKITATVGGVKKSNHKSFRSYRASCRKCGTIYSGILPLRKW